MAKRSKSPSPVIEPALESEAPPTSFEGLESLSTLQILDLIAQSLALEKVEVEALLYLRQRIADIEEMNEQAQEAIVKLDAAVTKLSSPANRVGTLLGLIKGSLALVNNGGGEYYCQIDPRLAQQKLLIGTRVLLNDAFVIVGDLGFDLYGSVYKVTDVLADNRLRVSQEGNSQQFFVQRSEPLGKERLTPGMEVRLDAAARAAVGSHRGASRRRASLARGGGVAVDPRRALPTLPTSRPERLPPLRPARLRQNPPRKSNRL
jgi:proteasome-associated ATPase